MPRSPRIALWGAGVMAHTHGAACEALGWRVVGTASRTPRAGTMSDDRILATPGVDLAIVSTPPSDHLRAVEAWAERGVPVVVSAPLCDTLNDADRLVEISARTPILLGSHLSAAPAMLKMYQRVAGLGALGSMTSRSVRPTPTWGSFTSGAWGGGVLFHPGGDHLALQLLVARLAGQVRPVSVAATFDGPASPSAELSAHARLRFAGGLRSSLRVEWSGAHPVWDLQVSSDSGVLRLDLHPTPSLEHNGEPVPAPVSPTTPSTAVGLAEVGFTTQLAAFWSDVQSGQAPVTGAEFGREVLEVMCAAYTSAGLDGADVALPFAGARDRTPHQLAQSMR